MFDNSDEDSSDDLNGEMVSGDMDLPATGLRLTESDLILERKNGVVIRSWPTGEISAARAVRQLNPFSLGLIGSACAMVYIVLSMSLSFWFVVGLYVLATLCGLVGLLVIMGTALRFEHQGKSVKIDCEDEYFMVDAFAQILNIK